MGGVENMGGGAGYVWVRGKECMWAVGVWKEGRKVCLLWAVRAVRAAVPRWGVWGEGGVWESGVGEGRCGRRA